MKTPPSPSEETPISPETLLAVRRYNQEVALYTLRQWNVAKLESEKKERDRRRRRAELLAQRQQAGAGGAGTGAGAGSGTGTGHSNGAGTAYGNQVSNTARPTTHTINAGSRTSDTHRSNQDGPLMMVSRRRSDRDRGGMSGSTSFGPAQSGYRPSHEYQRYDYAKRAHSIHNDIEHLNQMIQIEAQQTQDVGALQSTSVNRIEKPQRSSAHAPDPDKDFAKPVTNHIESATVEMTLAFDDANPYVPVEDEDGNEESLPPPVPVWQHRRSCSTPPIPIPRPPPPGSHRSDLGSSGSSATSARSASPARALGFSAHLGMTSISGAPSAALTGLVSVSASASTSNPNSEGSSRMSSFSEHNGGFRQGVSRKLTGEEIANGAPRPKRQHRSSMATIEPMVAERLDVSRPRVVESAIGHLRRMTVSGGERAIFDLDQH